MHTFYDKRHGTTRDADVQGVKATGTSHDSIRLWIKKGELPLLLSPLSLPLPLPSFPPLSITQWKNNQICINIHILALAPLPFKFIQLIMEHVILCTKNKTHMLWKHPASYSWVPSLAGLSGQWSQKSMERPNELWPWPMNLTYISFHLTSMPKFKSVCCPFGWDSETDRQTDKRCQNYYTHHVRDVGCNN